MSSLVNPETVHPWAAIVNKEKKHICGGDRNGVTIVSPHELTDISKICICSYRKIDRLVCSLLPAKLFDLFVAETVQKVLRRLLKSSFSFFSPSSYTPSIGKHSEKIFDTIHLETSPNPLNPTGFFFAVLKRFAVG